MTHPNSDEWMTLLYGEASPRQKTQFQSHLAQCAECAQRVNAWQQSINALDAWPNNHEARASRFSSPVKWAAAAVVVIGLGFSAGRFSASGTRGLDAAKAALRSEFQQRLDATRSALVADWQGREQAILASAQTASAGEAERLMTEIGRANAEIRAADLQTLYAALKQLDAKREQDYVTLRRELETVAVLTENSLVQLAGYRSLDEPDPQTPTP